MKRIYKILSIISLIISLLACDAMLDPDTDGGLDEDGVWGYYKYAFGILNSAYNNTSTGYNRISGAMLAAASDDAICPDPSYDINGFYNGSWGSYNLIDDGWDNYYEGIRKVNLFLEKIDSVELPVEPTVTGTNEEIYQTKERMIGEAHFLRALFYFELVRRFGGVPIIDRTLSKDEASLVTRASSDSCFQFIFKECDSAMLRLPYWYGEEPNIPGYNDEDDLGRATKGAALALKAKAQLYWASPLFNAENDIERWGMAAKTADSVINLTDSVGDLVYNILNYRASSTQLTDLFVPNSSTPLYNDEIIFCTEYTENNTVEKYNAPISFGGYALTVPTQSLVEAFPMLTSGKGIFEESSGYDENNPFDDRDTRLEMTVLYNGADYTMNGYSGVLETYKGGTDGPDAYSTASPTQYYLNKFMSSQAAWTSSTVKNSRTWIHLRISEVYLIYAEAILEYEGNLTAARSAVIQLRKKVSSRPRVSSSLSVEEMRELIRDERRIELAFEEQRFFDVRRWRLYDDEEARYDYENIRSCGVTLNMDDTYTYSPEVVKTRTWEDKMYLFPIPQDEILKCPDLTQNDGWN